MAAKIEVWLGYGASDEQAEEIRAIFASEDVPVEIRKEDAYPAEGNGAGFTIFVMLIGWSVGSFLTGFFQEAGKDTWKGAKALLRKLKADHFERYPSEPPTAEGLVAVKDVKRRIQVSLRTDLPDEAWEKLSYLDTDQQENVSYNWNDESREWEAYDLSGIVDLSPRTRDDPDLADY